MSNPIQDAVRRTGWTECVVAYLYEEFTEESEQGEDFLEYLADHVGTAAFVIAASGGAPVEACLEAYAQGGASVLDDDFDINDAIQAIHLAELPDDDTALYDED
jgi:hypothetical protein